MSIKIGSALIQQLALVTYSSVFSNSWVSLSESVSGLERRFPVT